MKITIFSISSFFQYDCLGMQLGRLSKVLWIENQFCFIYSSFSQYKCLLGMQVMQGMASNCDCVIEVRDARVR